MLAPVLQENGTTPTSSSASSTLTGPLKPTAPDSTAAVGAGVEALTKRITELQTKYKEAVLNCAQLQNHKSAVAFEMDKLKDRL